MGRPCSARLAVTELVEGPDEYNILTFRLPNGRLVDVGPLTYGRGRLHLRHAGGRTYDDEW